MLELETETPARPTLPPETYDRLHGILRSEGPTHAVEQLCAELQGIGDYDNLFYALLMKKRLELGVSSIPTGPIAALAAEHHEAYEEAIRSAGRYVARLHLAQRNFAQAWYYFRMLGEPEPMRQALDDYQPTDDEDVGPIIDIAWNQNVHPRRGFDLILQRYGVCNAITSYSMHDFTGWSEVQTYCIQALVRALAEQLRERLRQDLETKGVEIGPTVGIREILAAHPEIVAEDSYHIDTSHLASIVQAALQLPRSSTELETARALAAYGERLSPQFQAEHDPPFEKAYTDWRVYLEVIAGENVEAGLNHFREKLAACEEGFTLPAEVLVNLLLRSERRAEALQVARKYLNNGNPYRPLACPSVYELCFQAGDFVLLADAAAAKKDPVHYLAGLIEAQRVGTGT